MGFVWIHVDTCHIFEKDSVEKLWGIRGKKKKMMKTVVYRKTGGTDVMNIEDMSIPKIKPKSKEVLIKILASGLNPVDWKIRKHFGKKVGMKFPFTPCTDLSGVVVEANEKSRFKVDDYVFGKIPLLVKRGTASEYLVVEESEIAKAPESLTPIDAAAIPLVTLTALQAFRRGKLWPAKEKNEGKSILIHAGGGGLGSAAIPLAKMLKLKVYTTCSERSKAICEELGADVLIDYEKEKFEKYKYDYILDVMGGNYELRGMKCIKRSGHYMNILNSGWATKLSTGKTDGVSGAGSICGTIVGFLYVTYRYFMQYITGPYYSVTAVKVDGEMLEVIAKFIEDGNLKPIVDKVYPMQEVREAFTYLETGHAHGKVVLEVAKL